MSQNWKNRLLNHAEAPPEGLWDSIASKLEHDKLRERLANYEQPPPKDLWNAIAAELDANTNTAPVIPIKKEKNKLVFWKIAVAASIVSIIVISTFIIYKTPGANKSAVEIAKKTASPKISPADSTALNKTLLPKAPSIETAVVVKKPNGHKNKKENTSGPSKDDTDLIINFVTGNEVAALAADPAKIKADKLTNASGNEVNDIAYMSVPNSYITITGPNGEQIKVSSKFSKVINSITDRNPDAEEYIDKVIKESKFWKGKFKSWRDKMTNNTLAPSPTNFMDVIELTKLVNE